MWLGRENLLGLHRGGYFEAPFCPKQRSIPEVILLAKGKPIPSKEILGLAPGLFDNMPKMQGSPKVNVQY